MRITRNKSILSRAYTRMLRPPGLIVAIYELFLRVGSMATGYSRPKRTTLLKRFSREVSHRESQEGDLKIFA